MIMKGHMEDGKFHPHTDYKKGIRKSRDQIKTSQGIRLARTKTLPKLQRVKEQEDGLVKFWAESSDGNIVASLIQSKDFPDEMEIRITTPDDRFTVRGHKSIMDELSFNEFLDKVMMHIERHELTRKKRFLTESDVDRLSDLEIKALFKDVEKRWDGRELNSDQGGDSIALVYSNKKDPNYTFELHPMDDSETEDENGKELEEPIYWNSWYWFPAKNNKGLPNSPTVISETGGYTRKDAIKEFKKDFIIYDQEFHS